MVKSFVEQSNRMESTEEKSIQKRREKKNQNEIIAYTNLLGKIHRFEATIISQSHSIAHNRIVYSNISTKMTFIM